ncbi:MAG: tyrosine-type recombinase/integrase [Oscillibacter sp.]|uniref:tyrosine-type recombinase/integrase n=1 Tax=Oscillibacter sp. TaxID=1945593 RepID=UPI00216C2647|nr:tyrosine-type recombinase/integrase [Oscillibacter sp.]MCI9114827.1 tyrosine-type recombinase/integrase [Oscillibacter sp.]
MAKAKKRADGRYCAQIYLGRDENGKRQYKSVYAKSPAELKEKETAVRLQLGRGLDVLAQRDSFAAWADDWLRLKEREHITCRQMDNYRRAVKLWKEELQGYEIGQVRADDIERVLLTLADQGLSQRTVSLYRSAIRQILRRAVGRVIPANPAEQVELTAVGRKEEHRRALTAEEQQWIWDTPHRAQSTAVIMMLSGLRRGELAALTWADVDLEARTITVNKVMEYDSSGVPSLRHVTKTAAGVRTVDIPQRLADYMTELPRDNLLVIPSAHGGVMTDSAWKKLWSSYMRLLNEKYGTRTPADLERRRSGKPGPKRLDRTIPNITMHWLRHTFCTLLYLAGVDVVQACAQMGHADVSTTLRIYTHLDAIHKRKSVDKLDAYLSGQPGGKEMPCKSDASQKTA